MHQPPSELCYIFTMDLLAARIERDPRIAYALVFGSRARETSTAASDLDIAIGLESQAALSLAELGELAADFERDSGHPVDLVVLNDAPPGLAYRIFAEGRIISKQNHRAFVERKARAILEYLDFAPTEALFARGVIAAAANG